MDRCIENVIEWLNGQDVAAVTLSQQKYINKFRALAKEFPLDVQIIAENSDGSIFGHISLSAVLFHRNALKNKGLAPCCAPKKKEVE